MAINQISVFLENKPGQLAEFTRLLEKLERLARRASLGPDTVVYIDYGSEEMRGRAGMLRGFGRMAALLVERRVLVTSRMVPGGQHCEASWERQIPFFMNTLLYEP